jgi:hypothetical protein
MAFAQAPMTLMPHTLNTRFDKKKGQSTFIIKVTEPREIYPGH